MSAALEVEWLKLVRSRFVTVTTAVLVIGVPALVVGFMRAAAGSQGSAMAAKVHAMISGTGWPGYLNLAEQVLSVALFLGVGIVTAWCFGREFVDRTLVSLYALAVSRAQIAAAKLLVLAAWAAACCVVVVLVLLLAGPLAGIGWLTDADGGDVGKLVLIAVLTVMLGLTLSLPAGIGRGYLPAIGVMLLVILATQILASLGTGAWVPYAAPGLWCQPANPVPVEWMQLMLVPVTTAATTWATLVWWRRLQVT